MPSYSHRSGQASVELVALLPVLILLGLAVWQVVIAAQTASLAAVAARAAARAVAVGTNPQQELRRVVPAPFSKGATLVKGADGSVTVGLKVPLVAVGGMLGRLKARARFEPQAP